MPCLSKVDIATKHSWINLSSNFPLKVKSVASDLDVRNAEFDAVIKTRDEYAVAMKELTTKLRDIETEKATLQHKLDSLSEQHGSTEQVSKAFLT